MGGETEEKALALWMNSTLGILTLAAHRAPTEGSWVKFKKPALAAMPVLDVSQLSGHQLRDLSGAYDQLASRKLGLLHQMAVEETRAAVDAAIIRAIDIPNVSPIREALAREPIILNIGLTQTIRTREEVDTQLEFELV
jgi:hypothetical protein